MRNFFFNLTTQYDEEHKKVRKNPDNLKINVLSRASEMEPYRDQWGQLLKSAGNVSIFQSFDWIRAWMNSFDADKEIKIFMIFQGEELTGVIPVFIQRSRYLGLPVRIIRLAGYSDSDYNDLILREEGAEEAISLWMDYLATYVKKWDLMQFDEVPEGSRSPDLLIKAFEGRGHRVIQSETSICPFATLAGDYESYLKGMKKNYRKILKKKERRLAERGDSALKNWGGDMERLDHFLDVSAGLEGKSWKGEKGVGIFLDENHRRFHREFLSSETGRRHADLYFLTVDGSPMAYQYCFYWDNGLWAYNTAFDPDYSEFGPGNLMINSLIRKCCEENRFGTFDLMRGGEEYKAMWTDREKRNSRITVYSRTLYGKLLFMAESNKHLIKKMGVRRAK